MIAGDIVVSHQSACFSSQNELVCDGVSVSAIADAEGTPVYVYSAAAIRERYRKSVSAFGEYPHRLHYASRPTPRFGIARLLHRLGSGVDANSIGEIDVARRAGFAPSDIVFTGVGKSAAELECAVPLGLKAINVESAGELDRVRDRRASIGRRRVAVRRQPRTSTRRAIRTFPRVSRSTSSACRLHAARAGWPRSDRPPAVRSWLSTSTSARRSRPPSSRSQRAAGVDRWGGLRTAAERDPLLAYRSRRRPGHSLRRWAGVPTAPADCGRLSMPSCATGATGRRRAGPCDRRRWPERADRPRDRHQAARCGERVRGARRRHDRADAPGALRRVSPDRSGCPAPWRGLL